MKNPYTDSELRKRNARASRTAIKQAVFHVEQLTRLQIEQTFKLFGQVIPASTDDYNRRRTSYFYRREAIAWAREARLPNWQAITRRETAVRLAKSYLAIYRRMKGAN